MNAAETKKNHKICKQDEFPEIKCWKNFGTEHFTENVMIVIPPPATISGKFQPSLQQFSRRINHKEYHLSSVCSINFGTEVFFHLSNVAIFRRYLCIVFIISIVVEQYRNRSNRSRI